MPGDIEREVAAAVAWLDHTEVRDLLRLLIGGGLREAEVLLRQRAPDGHWDLTDAACVDALVEELELRLVPPDDEDQDAIATREIPDYTRYAHRLRTDGGTGGGEDR
ncbi:MAG: hypothetical protein KC621_20225 [Myxococcales bacterium]|nr:hypothetical protein [Myxococcales bacterium]